LKLGLVGGKIWSGNLVKHLVNMHYKGRIYTISCGWDKVRWANTNVAPLFVTFI